MAYPEPCSGNNYLVDHATLLISSFRRLTGRDLVKKGGPGAGIETENARRLFEAPFSVVSHTTDTDPLFNYGNLTALRVFELSWLEFTALPSRKSAEPMNRAERGQLLAAVSEQGYIDNYRGVRIASTGRRFVIEDATVWNLIDERGVNRGQAAVFKHWHDL